MTVYLDCAATTPIDPRVRDEVVRFLDHDYGNAGSRTHDLGRSARAAVERARDRVAAVVSASRGDVIFTSGATESNNLALLGLAAHGETTRRRHIVSTALEHHAVLEPLEALHRRGFEIELVAPGPGGVVAADAVARAVRADTLLVSVMQVNNETGMTQPVAEIAAALTDRAAFFHVDAAQGFGKAPLEPLRHPRIDLISVSGHKLHAPKGVGALIARKRGGSRPPLEPLFFGGGQERGLRPGTHPVPLIAGLGMAAALALDEHEARARVCRELRERIVAGLAPLDAVVIGDPRHAVPHIVSMAIPGLVAEQVIDAWQTLVAISQGAACTSQSYVCSHVLGAMAIPEWQQEGAVRLSWCHMTPPPDVSAMVEALQHIRGPAEPVR
jgi:cysteine desulfurase